MRFSEVWFPRAKFLFALLVVTALVWAAAGEPVVLAQGGAAQSKSEQPAKGKAPKKEQPAAAPAAAAPAAPNYGEIIKNLRVREIGPATMGGRIDDFAVVESNPSTVYAGTASGGIFKTLNGGTTWQAIFDNEDVSTIGDLAVAPSDPDTVWAGTGESNNRQSSSWGNGVYKSTDGGKAWSHMGLRETHHIARIVIHPTNPNLLYVAATGRLWGPSKERGIYKTTDGGKTWTNVLSVNEDTGATDIVMDPENPDTLYAAMYQRRRTVFGFNGSGPHGGIHKSTDGGVTWKKLINGLPWDPNFRPAPAGGGLGGPGGGGGGGGFEALAAQFGITLPQQAQAPPPAQTGPQEIGRIGLNVYRRDPRVVYALVEHRNGGIFRSEDKGETWTRMSDTNPRAMYYSQVHVDPNNDQRIWVLGAQMFNSEDGGRTFRQNLVQRIHGDYHALWINPANSDHVLTGSDGGIHWSWDRGRTWDFVNTIPLGQFYEIGADMRTPYYVCGGLQDNNTWCGPSATTNTAGIPTSEWYTVAGGDGYYAQIDPTDPNTVYAESQDGNVLRRDLRTHESRAIRPIEAEGEARYRFQWNSPIVISAHNPKTVYYGGNFLFKSTDRGDNWTKASPDLTNNEDRDKKAIMGKVPDRNTLSRHDGVQQWPCITTLSESSLNGNVVWAGTDDGNLQVTKDGGATWKNVTSKVPGVPTATYVSRVVASRHAEGTAYVTFDGHRMNDFNIYVFATTDFGESWKAIRNGIPDNNGIVNVIREHPKNADLLFAGAEYGAYVSFDRGANWAKLKLNLPTVPVDDILVHPRDNDLIFGTHGRSIWILDDLSALEQLNAKVAENDLHLFDIRPATMWRLSNRTTSASQGHKTFLGQNPPNGVIINYYLKNKVEPPSAPAEGAAPAAGGPQAAAQAAQSRVRITIADSEGKTIRQLDGTGNAGINRVIWDYRATSPIPPAAPGQAGPGLGFGGGGFAGLGAAAGPRVDPGTFTVKVRLGDKEVSKTVVVGEDPRLVISAEERAARRAALNTIAPVIGPAVVGQRGITAMRTALNTAIEGWKRPGGTRVPENVMTAAEDLLKRTIETCKLVATPQQCGDTQAQALGAAGPPLTFTPPNPLQRLQQVAGAIESYTAAPTAWQLEQIKLVLPKLQEAGTAIGKLVREDLPAFNKLVNEAGVPHVSVPRPGGGQRPPGADVDPLWPFDTR